MKLSEWKQADERLFPIRYFIHVCGAYSRSVSLQRLSACPGFEGKVSAEPVMIHDVDDFKPVLRLHTAKDDPYIILAIRHYRDSKAEGSIRVEAMPKVGRQTKFNWPVFNEGRDDMPTMAIAIEYLDELVGSAPTNTDALPCRQFETAMGQARLHRAVHILNIIYDDTPPTFNTDGNSTETTLDADRIARPHIARILSFHCHAEMMPFCFPSLFTRRGRIRR
jgi:hypothetical protein